ncbi:nucleotidyltransferase family protein [Oceanimonas marisflavi]|uniref:nucleotidyltransferase family protein n=1 Tax=Oceanimonas marisflavi TaxID=2059724 RepID=UPI000D307FBB|nr:nucleotidyltransferase domain-containing protein [Oceanimonas marisflavi]
MPQIDAAAMSLLLDCLKQTLPVQEGVRAYVFGSRAKHQARPYSDLDLALEHPCHPLPPELLFRLKSTLGESDLPFMVDIVDLRTISEEFRQAILPDLIPLELK